ncbi:hypothetical protein MAR_020528 [Mya arenaria]|uniref:HAT C-terminal dimerisation domain-containing protein n=1 Tax=Mya arenaria TaxID=6604 RepID=A0ABY7E7H9_MYAAR|nr:hypothetical protein MAR_020528 [Mya arenaria]
MPRRCGRQTQRNNVPAYNTEEYFVRVITHYQDDMPQPETFQQQLKLWKRTWGNKDEKPGTITETLSETCNFMYPNIMKILTLMMLTSVTSARVERSN